MLASERQDVLHKLAALLQDNLGNRITHTLINGICTTLDAIVPAVPDQPPPAAGAAAAELASVNTSHASSVGSAAT